MTLHPAQRGHPDYAFRWELLTLHGTHDGWLKNITDGRLERNVHAEHRASLTATVTLPAGDQSIDWTQVMIRPWVRVNGVEYPLGTFLPAIPEPQQTAAATVIPVTALDRTLRLSQHKTGTYRTVAEGQNLVAAMAGFIRDADPFSPTVAITPSTETARSPMFWGPEDSTLRIVNDLAQSLNYLAPWADEWGTYRAAPYVLPRYRPTEWEYTYGPDSRHLPHVSEEHNLNEVANRVIVMGNPSTSGDLGYVGVADNNDPDDPLSIPTIGVRAREYTGQDVASQAAADGLAARYLVEARQTYRNVRFRHVWAPHDMHTAGDIRLSWGPSYRGTLTKTSWELRPGALVDATVREV